MSTNDEQTANRSQRSAMAAIDVLQLLDRYLGTQQLYDFLLAALNDGAEAGYVGGWQKSDTVGEFSWYQGSKVPDKLREHTRVTAW